MLFIVFLCLDISQANANQVPLYVSDGLIVHLQADASASVVTDPNGNLKKWQNSVPNRNEYFAIPTQSAPKSYIDHCDNFNPNNANTTYAPNLVDDLVNGKPAIRFNSTNQDGVQICGLDIDSDEYTIFIVDAYSNSGVQKRGRLLNSRSYISWFLGRWAGWIRHYAGAMITEGKYPALDQFSIHTALGKVEAQKATRYYYLNGVNLTSDSLRNSSRTAYRPRKLGIANHGFTYSNEVSDGDVAELLVFERSLNDRERYKVNLYLATKYGLPLPPNPDADSYTISFDYSNTVNSGQLKQKMHLGVEDSKVKIVKYEFWSDIDHQPNELAWVAELTKNSQWFALKNLDYGTYLASNGSTSIRLEETPTYLFSGTEHYKDTVLWKIELKSAQGDYTLVNRATGNKLKFNQSNDTLELVNSHDDYDSDILFSLHERFISLKIFPEDIHEYNDLLHIPNGLPELGVFVPTPDNKHTKWTTRRFKVSAENHSLNTQYEFVSHPGFDVLNGNLTATQQDQLDILKTEINNIISKKSLDSEVLNSVLKQMSSAFNASLNEQQHNPSFVPGIVWLETNSERPAGFNTLETIIDDDGHYIKIIFTPHSSWEQVIFAFLLKETIGAQVNFILDDPPLPPSTQSPVTKPKEPVKKSTEKTN